jgi:DNA-binding LytR/AlgR family response regulator
MSFRYLVVDDEQLARKLIRSHADKCGELVFCGECASAVEAINVLRKSPVDVIFLDIQMPELTGLEFIRTMKAPPAIVLTTAHREFGPDAFDLDVVDYLVKPISFERFLKAVNKLALFQRVNTGPTTGIESPGILYVKADRKIYPVELADVLYVESLDNYVKIHIRNRILITRENISQLEARLPSHWFIRIHRSFLVSRKHVESITSETIQVGGKELPVGRAFRHAAMESLK